ncbi:MAG: peptidase family protein [Acidimicrobiales bacterium]|nr:peptidase family protein [Acidimicrobiales bacterium]
MRALVHRVLAVGVAVVLVVFVSAPPSAARLPPRASVWRGALPAIACRGRSAIATPGPRTYRPPVRAPVIDPFRPPPQPWLPGNRGIEYATVPGTRVRAIGPGRVSFAGPVGGSLHVTVTHADGLRSSYSFLAAVRVRRGAVVAAGVVVGVAGARLHLGVRRGRRYLDPASLWGCAVAGGRVHLVPLDGGPAVEPGAARGVLGPPPRHRYTRSSAHHRGAPISTSALVLPRSSLQRSGAALRIRVSHNRWEERAPCQSPSSP